MSQAQVIQGDALEVLRTLPAECVQTCITSPPYYHLRDYGVAGQIGLEPTPDAYVARLVEVFAEVKRVLRDDGTLWLNLGDTYCSTAPGTMGDPLRQDGILAGVTDETAQARRKYRPKTPAGLKPKDLVGVPWLVAFALRADGWWLRSEIIWHKPDPMPESVQDRPTKAHEQVFLLAKSERYFYDADAVAEQAHTGGRVGLDFYPRRAIAMGRKASGNEAKDQSTGIIPATRNRRSVWTIASPLAKLRDDLTPKQKAYVVDELLKRGLL